MNRAPLEVVESVIDVAIAIILSEKGFVAIEKRAQTLLRDTLINYMVYKSRVLKTQSELARRSTPTLIDAVVLMKNIDNIPESKETIKIEEEHVSLPEIYESDICSHVDCPSNYYDFLPCFPAAHTFKNTPIKRRILDDRTQKARIRNEQATKIIENLFGIVKKKKQAITSVNYLFQQ